MSCNVRSGLSIEAKLLFYLGNFQCKNFKPVIFYELE